ncbi:MAG: hypothetical protein V4510_06275 [bacterium]
MADAALQEAVQPSRARLGMVGFGVGVFALTAPLAIAVGLLVWNHGITPNLLGWANVVGFLFGLPAIILSRLALRGARKPLLPRLGQTFGVIGMVSWLVAFGIGFNSIIPEPGTHVGPGSCESDALVATLSSIRVVHNVTTNSGDATAQFTLRNLLAKGNLTSYLGGGSVTIRAGGGDVHAPSKEWKVGPGASITVNFALGTSIPSGPWTSFDIQYGTPRLEKGEGAYELRQMSCSLEGDGAPAAFENP